MQFSFIHQATPATLNPSDFLQLQFSSAINRLDNASPSLDMEYIEWISREARSDTAAASSSTSEPLSQFDQNSCGIQLLDSVCKLQREWRAARDFFSPRPHQPIEERTAPQPLDNEGSQNHRENQMARFLPDNSIHRIGAILTLYCLWRTQLVDPKILIYVPLVILDLLTIKMIPELQLTNCPGAGEALSCLLFLNKANAFMVGALIRPPFQSYHQQRRSHMVRKDMNGIDALMESSTMREALFRVRGDLGSLVDMGDLTRSCQEYEQRRSLVFQTLLVSKKGTSSQGEVIPHLFPPNYSSQLLDLVKNEAAAVNSDLLPSNRPQQGSRSKSVVREQARLAATERSAAAADELPLNALLQIVRATPAEGVLNDLPL